MPAQVDIPYEAVQELADQGHGRNEIAKELKVTTYVVDKACSVLGIEWENEKQSTSARVRSRRAAVERAAVAEKLRAVATMYLDQVLTGTAKSPKDSMTVAGIAIQRELEVAGYVAERGEHSERTPEEIKAAQQRDTALSLLEYLD